MVFSTDSDLLIYACNIKVKKSTDFLVWDGKTRSTMWTWTEGEVGKNQILPYLGSAPVVDMT